MPASNEETFAEKLSTSILMTAKYKDYKIVTGNINLHIIVMRKEVICCLNIDLDCLNEKPTTMKACLAN